jgi:hypothetical protein
MIDTLAALNWKILAGGGFLVLLVGYLVARRLVPLFRDPKVDEKLSSAFTVIGLSWSAEAMWEIAHGKMELETGLCVLIFMIFEAALFISMLRAKRHMVEFGWPGRYGKTVWGLALFIGLVSTTVSGSFSEVLVRFAVPLVVAKLWWDGVIGGAQRPADEVESEWTFTVDRMLRGLRLKRQKAASRDVLVERMTRLEFLRVHGSQRFGAAGRRAWKLRQMALKASDDVIAEVRHNVARADWFTVTQDGDAAVTRPAAEIVTHADAIGDAAPAGSDDAVVTRLTQARDARRDAADDAVVTQPEVTQIHRAEPAVTSGDAVTQAPMTDPATQAALLYRTGQFKSLRAAADAIPGASEATTRRRFKDMADQGDAPVRELVTQAS